MKSTSIFISLLATIIMISCSTPEKAFEKGNYTKTIKLATKSISKGKEVEVNKKFLQLASYEVVENTLASNSYLISSPEVKDWKRVQSNYFMTLELIGKANKVSDGSAREAYDKLCDQKTDLDFSIAEYYHLKGDKYLDESRLSGSTAPAREAFGYYNDCMKNGGTSFYKDLEDLLEESLERGTIYYIAYDGATVGGRFLKPLPSGADWIADCEIFVDRGFIQITETERENRQALSEEIVVGQNAITDTSGVTTYEPIYEDIVGAIVTTTITVTASSQTNKVIQRNTEECFLGSSSFRSEVADTYEEIRYEGDSRTWPNGARNRTGEPSFFQSNLENELEREIRRRI